jgi:hypothetical protein
MNGLTAAGTIPTQKAVGKSGLYDRNKSIRANLRASPRYRKAYATYWSPLLPVSGPESSLDWAENVLIFECPIEAWALDAARIMIVEETL